ncbi:MAG: hypothetical protein HYS44_02405 [Candidatus Niyogibacteria bacterium]|nr:hypothetical protein [Candidatus Niyogibacteria bacterium]
MLRSIMTAALMFIALFFLTACNPNRASESENIGKAGCLPLNYEYGVLYFPCNEAKFGNALSQFKKQNPGTEIEAMTGNGAGAYGENVGYFVVIRAR